MAIRLRIVEGQYVAMCAVETDPQPGDIYLDDGMHYALAAKFCRDWQGENVAWNYPREWALMDTQKLRDCRDVWAKIDAANAVRYTTLPACNSD